MTFSVLILLLFVAVKGDAHLRREIDELHEVAERSDFSPRGEDSALGTMMEPRADPGAIASSICGYLGGQANIPWVCLVESIYCVIEPSEGVVGCCYGESTQKYCGAFRTACFAQTDPCDSACSKNGQNLICSGAEPICATYTYPSSVTEVRCESTIPSILSVAYTYSGFSTPILLPRVVAGFSITSQGAGFSYLSLVTGTQYPPSSTAAPSSTPLSTFATSTSISSSSSAAITSTPGPAPSSNTGTSAASASSPAPVGAIVGGVLGGIAIIALFAALVLCLRYKRNQTPAADPLAQMSNTNNPASAFQLPPTAAASANAWKDGQAQSMVNEAYAPVESDRVNGAYAPVESGHYNELPGQTRNSRT